MARSRNKIELLGNLGGDVEMRYTANGAAIATFSLATTERYKDREGEPQEKTEWHRIKVFGKLAELAGEFLGKGSSVLVDGSLHYDNYTDKQGVDRIAAWIRADEITFLDSKERSQGRGDAPSARANAPSRRSGPVPNSSPAGPRPNAGQQDSDDDPFNRVPF